VRVEWTQERPGLVAALLARAEAWLLEPAVSEPRAARPAEPPVRPVVAVVGLAPRCGATTLARALAARLATGDPSRAAIVAGQGDAPAFAPAARAAARLAARVGSGGLGAQAAGRLCLASDGDHAGLAASARRLAPLVLDVARDRSPSGAASLADLTVLVAPGDGEPALAELAARSIARAGREPVTVASRADDPSRWSGRAVAVLPESRSGARLATAGWEPRGALGAAVAGLASLCEEATCA
jgi:hypothetical protein